MMSSQNLDNTVEKDLIIALTELESQNRPSASEIRDVWLPRWQE